MVGDNLITAREAAEISGLATRTIVTLCNEGKIPARKIGRQFVVKMSWAEAERKKRTPPEGYVTITEAMKTAGVTRSRMHQLIRSGQVRSFSRFLFERRIVWVERVSLEQWMRETHGE